MSENKRSFEQLINDSPISRSKQLYKLLPEIEDALKAGVRQADLVAYLNENGITISVKVFRNFLFEARKKRGHKVSPEQQFQRSGDITTPPPVSPTPHSVEAQEIAAPAKAIEKSPSSQPLPSETPRKMSWKEMRKKQVDY